MYFKFTKRALLETVFKGLATWVIFGGALFILLDVPISIFALLIVAGLVMGMAGDIALSLPNPGFTSGMLFFGLGHVCYIISLIIKSEVVLIAIPAFVVLYTVFLIVYFKLGIKPPESLKIPVIMYSIIIISMLSLAVTMPFSQFPGGLILLFAGIFFVISDAILAYNCFPNLRCLNSNLTPADRRGIVSLSCYFFGQSLFAVSIYYFS
jgi:uncharacterized membrane protein YhhN